MGRRIIPRSEDVMERRFGFKDLIVLLLLIAVLVSVWLAMIQFDRQWNVIRQVRTELSQQAGAQSRIERQLGEIRESLSSGVTVTAGDREPLDPDDVPSDPFPRIREAREQPAFAEGDWLIDSFGAKVAKITPLVSTDAYASAINARVLETLGQRDPVTLEWHPHLAESWKMETQIDEYEAFVERMTPILTEEAATSQTFAEYLDKALQAVGEENRPQPDTPAYEQFEEKTTEQWVRRRIEDHPDFPVPIRLIFQIRRGVSFSDGEPLTADDVAFTYDLIMNPAIEAPRLRAYYRLVRDVEATGTHEVVFTFREPYFMAMDFAAGMEILPEHFYSQFTAEEINQEPGLLMGSGPYRMADPTGWAPDKPLELVRNARYWGVRPAWDRLIYREINNPVAQLQAYRNGEIDLFRAQPEQYVQLIDDEQVLERSHHFEYERASGGYGFIAWNERRAGKPTPFADPRVRLAMTMLTNRQYIADEILKGFGIIPTGPFNRLSPQYNQDIEPWPHDVQRARELLAQAGYEDRDGDGVVEDPSGRPLRFALTFPSSEGGGGFWDKTTLFLRDTYAAGGVIMDLDPLEWAVFRDKLASRDFDAISLAWGGTIEGDPYQIFHSSQIKDGGDNFISFSSPEMDALIEQARRELDEDKRMQLWHECHTLFHELQPYTFLYTRKSLVFLDERIHNVERVPLGLNDIYEWYVPEPMQKY
jgi:peptide/nickel transport system substrate-binding protein